LIKFLSDELMPGFISTTTSFLSIFLRLSSFCFLAKNASYSISITKGSLKNAVILYSLVHITTVKIHRHYHPLKWLVILIRVLQLDHHPWLCISWSFAGFEISVLKIKKEIS